jgi:hypothetical protein
VVEQISRAKAEIPSAKILRSMTKFYSCGKVP